MRGWPSTTWVKRCAAWRLSRPRALAITRSALRFMTLARGSRLTCER